MADLTEAYRRFNPAQPLDGDLLEQYYVGRPRDPVGKLAKLLEVSETAQHILLVGQRGVGKTTELRRLAKMLEPDLNTVVLTLNLDDYESISNPALGISRLIQGLIRNVKGRGFWGDYDLFSPVDIDRASHETTAAAALFAETIESIRKVTGRNPVLLIDGLEKKRGEQLAETARFIRELGRFECSMVVVIPIGLALLPDYSSEIAEWDKTVFLPAISLRDPEGRPDMAGCDLLIKVLGRRHDEKIFSPEAQTLLVSLSAGIHRTLLTLAQDACLSAMAKDSPLPVGKESVDEAADERRLEMSGFLTPRLLAKLTAVRETKAVDNDTDTLPLLERNVIVLYQDSKTWYDVNPLVGSFFDAYNRKM
jgi:energy-coupling factor transporter ATP-binding protein EcfA2